MAKAPEPKIEKRIPKAANGAAKTSPDPAAVPVPSIVPASVPLSGHRELLQQRMGQVALAVMRLPRYAKLPIADLGGLVVDPLLSDRIAFAQSEDDPHSDMPIGMAIWASASDAVSAKIAEQVNAGAFPLGLDRGDWASGENVWLIDLIVPNRRAGTAVFLNFGKLIGDRSFRLHPVVLQSVDRAIFEKFRGLGQDTAATTITQ